MRYICLVAIVLALPLNASAQQRRAAGRGPTPIKQSKRRALRRTPLGRRASPTGADPTSVARSRSGRRARLPCRGGNASRRPGGRASRRRPGRTGIPRLGERQRRARVARSTAPPAAARRTATPQPTADRRAAIADRATTRRQWCMCCRPSGYFSESIADDARSLSRPRRGQPRAVTPEPHEPLPPMGALRLEVEPKESLQIFVDGVYIGTPADLGDRDRARARHAPHRAARARLSHADVHRGDRRRPIDHVSRLARKPLRRRRRTDAPVAPVAPVLHPQAAE